MFDDATDDFSTPVTVYYDASEKSVDQAIRDAGLDPKEWIVEKAGLSAGPKGLTLRLSLMRSLLRPVVPQVHLPQLSPPYLSTQQTIVVLGDTQCPYHDLDMHLLVCKFLNRFKPNGLIAAGDIFDFPTMSSYLPNPMTDTDLNRGLTCGHAVLLDWAVAAGPGCKKWFLPGNHEQRLIKYLLRHAPNLWGVKRVGETRDALALDTLAGISSLGYEYVVGETGEWPQAMVHLVPGKLSVAHGWLVRRGAGNTARASAEHLGRSCVVCHTHRQGVLGFTKNNELIQCAENGCLCQIRGGLGYGVEPDWMNGFTVVQIFPDNSFVLQPVYRIENRLVYGTEIIE